MRELKTKNYVKNSKKLLNILHNQFFFFCMYKMDSFALLTANAWRKNGTEVIKYSGEIWINQGHLQEKRDLSNISDRTQYYSDEFKNMGCEIQEYGNYQPYRVFVHNILAV